MVSKCSCQCFNLSSAVVWDLRVEQKLSKMKYCNQILTKTDVFFLTLALTWVSEKVYDTHASTPPRDKPKQGKTQFEPCTCTFEELWKLW